MVYDTGLCLKGHEFESWMSPRSKIVFVTGYIWQGGMLKQSLSLTERANGKILILLFKKHLYAVHKTDNYALVHFTLWRIHTFMFLKLFVNNKRTGSLMLFVPPLSNGSRL